jgi:CheY-like chemotaxis protein
MSNFGIVEEEKKTILLVDDVVENLQLLTGLLKDDYRVKIAKNGLKAIEIAKQSPSVDLILMDVIMPEMDGYTACSILKQEEKTSHIPIIFLTSLNEAAQEAKGFDFGGADFISKPFNSQVVKARIRTHLDLQSERNKADTLLRYLLPTTVIKELKSTGNYVPVIHQNTSIMFCDIIDFTSKAAEIEPDHLVSELSELFTAFDEIILNYNGLRIKTLGDGYMAATGLDKVEDFTHADNLVQAGLDMINFLIDRNQSSKYSWECRIGIHSGPVMSGVIGKSRCQFDIMGDNVNIAARVENNGLPMKIVITEDTASFLKSPNLILKPLGEFDLKGRGLMNLIEVSRI